MFAIGDVVRYRKGLHLEGECYFVVGILPWSGQLILAESLRGDAYKIEHPQFVEATV